MIKIATILIACLPIAGQAHTVYCPSSQDGVRLSGATMYIGKPEDRGELIGESINTRSGRSVIHRFRPKEERWLACYYGNNRWTAQLDSESTECKMTFINHHKSVVSISTSCKR